MAATATGMGSHPAPRPDGGGSSKNTRNCPSYRLIVGYGSPNRRAAGRGSPWAAVTEHNDVDDLAAAEPDPGGNAAGILKVRPPSEISESPLTCPISSSSVSI
jgi:hypothetical protein